MKHKKLLEYPFVWSVFFVLSWSVFYFFFGEKISINNGCGYDGLFYCEMTQKFDIFIQNRCFSTYYVNRILPCGIVHFSLRTLGFSTSLPNIIIAFYVLNTLSWLGFLFLWHKILHQYHISRAIQWLMVLLILINFYFLKFTFYYPTLTDSLAFLLGTLLLWFYIKNKAKWIFIVGFLGSFVYPLFCIYSCILLIFPINKTFDNTKFASKTYKDYILIAILLVLYVVIRIYYAHRIQYALSTGFHWNTMLYAIIYGYVLYHILPSLNWLKVNIKPIIAYFLQKKTLYRIIVAIILLSSTILIKKYLSQYPIIKNPTNEYLIKSLLGIGYHGALRVVEYFSAFGLIAIFIIFNVHKISIHSFRQSLGLGILSIGIIVLKLCVESRAITDIYVFLLLALAISLNEYKSNFSIKYLIFLGVLNGILSKFFLLIENGKSIWHSIELQWIPTNYALSSYLMNDEQYLFLCVGFLMSAFIVIKILKRE